MPTVTRLLLTRGHRGLLIHGLGTNVDVTVVPRAETFQELPATIISRYQSIELGTDRITSAYRPRNVAFVCTYAHRIPGQTEYVLSTSPHDRGVHCSASPLSSILDCVPAKLLWVLLRVR